MILLNIKKYQQEKDVKNDEKIKKNKVSFTLASLRLKYPYP